MRSDRPQPQETATGPPSLWRSALPRLPLFLLAIVLFAASLLLIREGVAPFSAGLHGLFHLESPASALGFGWLFATLALSGSPVAATALSFLDAQVFGPTQTFAMISGSRLGAAFVVLVVGFFHVRRGRKATLSLSAGLLSLLVTQTTYLLVIPLGLVLLRQGWMAQPQVRPAAVVTPFELLLQPVLDVLVSFLPEWSFILTGLVLLLVTFRLFDRALPPLHLEASRAARINRLLYRPIVSFMLGAVVTALTLSVSVSLGLLVPLSVRGYIRQENVVPYALGANITTFVDTLLAAALLGNPVGVGIVLVQMVSVAAISLLVFAVGMRSYERLLGRLMNVIGRTPISLGIYLVALFALPLALLLGG
jgi:Na+/phosphate symporter